MDELERQNNCVVKVETDNLELRKGYPTFKKNYARLFEAAPAAAAAEAVAAIRFPRQIMTSSTIVPHILALKSASNSEAHPWIKQRARG